MANIYIKSDERSEYVAELLKTYIRINTVHNLAVYEKNADICLILNIPEYPASNASRAYVYNNDDFAYDIASKIFYQFGKAAIPVIRIVKRSMPKDEYDTKFVTSTLIIDLTNDQTNLDHERYAVAIGQGIVSYYDPGATFETFASKKKDQTVKRQHSEKKVITEPTSNSKLLFKKN